MTKAYTYEEAVALFNTYGCELLEKTYKNVRIPMSYRCICGQEAKISLAWLLTGGKCQKCKGKKSGECQRPALILVQDFFHKEGCTLLEPQYKNANTKMLYLCKCGNESTIKFSHFKNGVRCRKCGINKYRKVDREAIELRKRVYNFVTSLLRKALRKKHEADAETRAALGYTGSDLRQHIENHERWNDVRVGKWHLDHIFPVAAFVSRGIHDPMVINALDNLQPLSAKENISKKDKYDRAAFESYLSTKGIA